MKTLLFLTLLISGSAIAQTNVIATKSHGSTNVIDKNNSDNFGLPSERRIVKSVEYLEGDCLVETVELTMFETRTEIDTICDHPFLQNGKVDIKRMKEMYSNDVEFIGFDSFEADKKKERKRLRKVKKEEEKSSGLILFLIGGTLFLAYLFVPKMSFSR